MSYQKEVTARGSEAVKLARDTIGKTGRNRGPHRSWGHEVKPIQSGRYLIMRGDDNTGNL